MKLRSFHGRVCAAVVCVGLAACSTPLAPRYHTLLSTPAQARDAVPAFDAAWELLPVSMPVQVEQPQLVVRADDGTMALLEGERWVAPLNEEMRAALGDRLSRALGGDGRRGMAATRSGWRIRVDVKRFDSMPGRAIRLDAHWALLPGDEALRPLRCQTLIEQPVPAGYPALSAAHRAAAIQLADAIAATLRRVAAEPGAGCP